MEDFADQREDELVGRDLTLALGMLILDPVGDVEGDAGWVGGEQARHQVVIVQRIG